MKSRSIRCKRGIGWFPSLLFSVVLLVSSPARAAPTYEQARKELPYLRMSLVMNAVLHLIQYPLSLDGKLVLPPSRAFVSFGGGLLYATTAGLSFSSNQTVRDVGTGGFMALSAGGAAFVTTSLISCTFHRARSPTSETEQNEMGCRARYFDALNVAILANQILAWTLGIRQFTAERTRTTRTIEMPLIEARF